MIKYELFVNILGHFKYTLFKFVHVNKNKLKVD